MKKDIHYIIYVTALASVALTAQAHRLEIAYFVENQAVIFQALFDDDEPVMEGDITILDMEGNVLAIGETDAEGRFVWEKAVIQPIEVKVYAGLGHKRTVSIAQEELQQLFAEAGTPRQAERTYQEPVDKDPLVIRIDDDQSVQSWTRTVNLETPPHSQRSSTRSTSNSWGTPERIVLGLIFLFAAMSAWYTHRLNAQIRELKEHIKKGTHQKP
ncbi:MAG: hypothetical protein ACOX5R_18860 [bacterium]|jgi:hypothetical protein